MTDLDQLARNLFEKRVGFAFTEEYRGSREYSDAEVRAGLIAAIASGARQHSA